MDSGRSGWRLVSVGDERAEDMSELFEKVFAQTMSPELWRWKYAGGRGMAVGALSPQGVLLAHYGGTRRDLQLGKSVYKAVQIGDVMVAAEGRSALSGKGPFGLVTEAFLDKHIKDATDTAFGFGFPSPRHMRLGQRLGHYQEVERIYELTWVLGDTTSDALSHLAADTEPEPESRFRAVELGWNEPETKAWLDRLGAGMHEQMVNVVMPVRSASWWHHRFADHPEKSYVCVGLPGKAVGEILAAFVLREPQRAVSTSARSPLGGGQIDAVDSHWELMDWMASPSQTSVVVEAALAFVQSRGGKSVGAWLSETVTQHLQRNRAVQLHVVCSAAVTVAGRWANIVATTSQADPLASGGRIPPPSWWLTGGDTDFR